MRSFKEVLGSVMGSKELASRFCSICIQLLNCRKQHSRKFCFCLLGYGTVFAALRKEYDTEMKDITLGQMEEACKKLLKTGANGEQDLFWWGLGKIVELWSKPVKNVKRPPSRTQTFYTLFSSEEACLVHRKYLNYNNYHLDEVSISTLIWLHTVIMEAADNLVHTIAETRELLTVETTQSQDLYENDPLTYENKKP